MDKTHVEAEVAAHSQNKSRNLTMSDSSGGAGNCCVREGTKGRCTSASSILDDARMRGRGMESARCKCGSC